MPPFLFAFAAVLLVSFGSRDQVLVARLSARLGRGPGLLLVGALAAAVSAAAMAAAGGAVAGLLPQRAGMMLAAFALVLAALELAWPVRLRDPAQPTRSLGAIFLVLLAGQLTDGARFLVFAIATATGAAGLTGTGGALGGILAIAAGWALSAELEQWGILRPIRIALAILAAVIAVGIGLAARGLVG